MDNFTHDPSRICALILAGGAGRRVAGRDKGLLQWHGLPLVAHVHDTLAPQVSEIIISCNRNRERYARIAPLAPPDLRTGYQGPLAGLEAAAPMLQRDFILLAPCDTPALPPELAARLACALQQKPGAQAAFVRAGNRNHYLCALLRRASLAGLGAYLDRGQRAVRHWYTRLDAVPVDFPAQQEAFANFNDLGDFA
ncbi:molybdenum cofactor guanylyltransferase [Seongchinamella sediminis]|uniref:Molybdenum cofactor guanylyltransferase n=1 Tax=Seongchinamella sediminis TaxID=2283635 RepID=A0A3L7DY99_9GAMM|nr:molybdenum cofactor guanylyltransferase MobA [Seongchinamella sediminis]RLQ21510.1 molybdenum cofactor guanylyltransferase [Seongchinamella sediminis]